MTERQIIDELHSIESKLFDKCGTQSYKERVRLDEVLTQLKTNYNLKDCEMVTITEKEYDSLKKELNVNT